MNLANKKQWTLTERQLCDIELIMDGSFSPINGFMGEEDYNLVLNKMRLKGGQLFPLPIVLDISKSFYKAININEEIILSDLEGFQIAKMRVNSKWKPDLNKEAELLYGTLDTNHPAVDYLLNYGNKFYMGGEIEKIAFPNHYDYNQYRLTPKNAKENFKKLGWEKIIAFQTRNPLHRAHVEMTMHSMNSKDACLFLHPVVGLTKTGDIDYFTRVRCYEKIIQKYPNNKAMLALLPLAMRMGGPREALLHALIRKNFGCTHIIIGRDHAGPGKNSAGKLFYGPYESQKLVQKFENEIGIKMIPFQFMVYVPKYKKYEELSNLEPDVEYKTLSGTELRDLLDKGEEVPEWFSYPEVTTELKKSNPPRYKRGFTVFLTGLSGSGKSTIANGLLIKLLEHGSRPVTLLDGDIVRTHLSSELGFSKAHRSLNVQRIGYVASEITKNRGIAICAPIAPYELDRHINRRLISKFGGYIELYVSTNLERCEERDSKGLYKLARDGKITDFTGISDPYEVPKNPDIVVNSDGKKPPSDLVNEIFQKLCDFGYLRI